MARLPYVASADAAAAARVDRIYSQIRRFGRPVAHLYQVLANQPAALEAFLVMSHYVRDSSSISPPLREIAILATARELGQRYEIAHHRPAALKAGVTDETIAAILAAQTDAVAPAERAVIGYARQVARETDADDATFGALRSHFTNAEIVDIVLTVAWYHLCGAILGPLRVELEADLAGLD